MMNTHERETLQRMIGKIEGVAFVLDDKHATPILDAVEVIDAIIESEVEE